MYNLYLLNSNTQNVYKNLAFESCLLNFIESNKSICILFWENKETVVIGRYQNPYFECNLEYLKKNNIKVARRITGGGAVYHTKGNLNFTFILPIKYDKHFINKILLEAFNRINIKAFESKRNDLLVENRKFSGHAFYRTKNTFLHHGTILIDLPKNDISSILTPDNSKLAKNSVKSVESRIINLKEIRNDITPDLIKKSIVNSFKKNFTNIKEMITSYSPDIEFYSSQYKKFKSNEWIYGNYEDYSIFDTITTPDGKIDFLKNINGEISISSDFLETEKINCLLNKIKNTDTKNIKESVTKILKL